MIPPMPRPRPPYLHREVSRHGRAVWYVRVGRGSRIRLTADYGTDEFQRQYRDAVQGASQANAPARQAGQGTLRWGLALYRQSAAWQGLSRATRRQRDNIYHHVVETAGDVQLTELTRARIVAGRDRRAGTPHAARHFLQAMRSLFVWAVEMEIVTTDPTASIRPLKVRSEGHPVWTEADIAAYHARWPVGTRERVAFDVLLHTGLRRGDAVKLGRQHIRQGVARITTEKTGERVAIAVSVDLQHTLAAGPCGDLTLIAGVKGQPRVKEAFGEWFRRACVAAGVRKSAHGLRKAAATRDAARGFSEAELEAKYGWRGGRMASHYTRSVDRERLSLAADERTQRRGS